MTLSISDPPSAWHRTLPTPAALLSNATIDAFPRRSSSLLQHHLVRTEPFEQLFTREFERKGIISHAPQASSIESAFRAPLNAASDTVILSPATVEPDDGLTRKRHASIMVEDNLSAGSSTPTSTSALEGAGQFCLCQPDPKIPRPRNAFILYRQHHQAAVVAQNPGLPNPEISKLIGEQWRRLSSEAKNEWKALAEEEKARHQQQYPDYRYQPKRNGRYSSQSSISGPSSGGTIGPKGNCLKCGGKIMNPPSTPYSGYTPVTSTMPQPMIGYDLVQRGYPMTAPQQQRFPQYQFNSPPHSARQRTYTEKIPVARHDPRLRYHGAQPPPTTPMTDTHDLKRRKYNGTAVHIPSREVHPSQVYQFSPQNAAFTQPQQTSRQVIQTPTRIMYTQAPQQLPPSHISQAPPVQLPHHQQHRRELSLTLPPLKTAINQQPMGPNQQSSMEAMIMSIPVLNKIKILSQISPHLAAPGIGSPPLAIRGAIIAVEGMDPASVYSMTISLAEQLEREGKFAVRIFGGPDPYSILLDHTRRGSASDNGNLSNSALNIEGCLRIISQWHQISREMFEYITTEPEVILDTNMSNTNGPGAQPNNNPSNMVLDASSSARRQKHTNEEILPPTTSVRTDDSHITNAPTEMDDDASGAMISPRTITKTAGLSLVTPSPTSTFFFSNALQNVSSLTRIPPVVYMQQHHQQQQQLRTAVAVSTENTDIPPPPPTPLEHIPSSPPPPPPSSSLPASPPRPQLNHHKTHPQPSHPNRAPIPIALVPHYQLTTVDATSISMPILDAYSPTAHWQWLATLWRGCIGPDVSVVIKGTTDDETPIAATAAGSFPTNHNHGHHSSNSMSNNSNGDKEPIRSSTGSTVSQMATATSSTAKNNGPSPPAVEVRLHDHRAVVVRTHMNIRDAHHQHYSHGVFGSMSGTFDAPATTAAGGATSVLQYQQDAGAGGSMPTATTMMSPLEAEMWEKAKRRVGFEVAEFLRR